MNIPPRFSFLPREVAGPPNLDMTNMLRPRIKHDKKLGDTSRCQVPYNVCLLHEAVDVALRSAMLLLEKLNFEFDAVLHSVGCNQDMSALLRDSATCWDLSVRILQSPSVQRLLAFRRVVEQLRPILVQTLYPTGNPFGGVSPYLLSDDVWCM